MARFHLRDKPHPNEVSVAIIGDGRSAKVSPPLHAGVGFNARDLRLANALHYAGAIAQHLGTDVGVLDESNTIFLIEDHIIRA